MGVTGRIKRLLPQPLRLRVWLVADGLLSSALIARVLGERQIRVLFLDGKKRRVPRRLAAEMSLWVDSGALADEIHASYGAYVGGDVVDVGAWHGFYRLSLAPKANPGDTFVSFEPDPNAFPVLLETLAVAARLFAALPFAAGTGEGALIEWPYGHGLNKHPSVRSGGGSQPTVRLDHAVAALQLRPTFVKVDVEGAEIDVPRGMPDVIATGPTVMLELHPWQTYDDLEVLLPAFRRVDVVDGSSGDVPRILWNRDDVAAPDGT